MCIVCVCLHIYDDITMTSDNGPKEWPPVKWVLVIRKPKTVTKNTD